MGIFDDDDDIFDDTFDLFEDTLDNAMSRLDKTLDKANKQAKSMFERSNKRLKKSNDDLQDRMRKIKEKNARRRSNSTISINGNTIKFDDDGNMIVSSLRRKRALINIIMCIVILIGMMVAFSSIEVIMSDDKYKQKPLETKQEVVVPSESEPSETIKKL